jgi:hypothetical protein
MPSLYTPIFPSSEFVYSTDLPSLSPGASSVTRTASPTVPYTDDLAAFHLALATKPEVLHADVQQRPDGFDERAKKVTEAVCHAVDRALGDATSARWEHVARLARLQCIANRKFPVPYMTSQAEKMNDDAIGPLVMTERAWLKWERKREAQKKAEEERKVRPRALEGIPSSSKTDYREKVVSWQATLSSTTALARSSVKGSSRRSPRSPAPAIPETEEVLPSSSLPAPDTTVQPSIDGGKKGKQRDDEENALVKKIHEISSGVRSISINNIAYANLTSVNAPPVFPYSEDNPLHSAQGTRRTLWPFFTP